MVRLANQLVSADIGERFVGVRFGFGDGIGLHNLAVRADEDGHAGCAFLVGAFRGTVGQGDGTVRVAKQVGG